MRWNVCLCALLVVCPMRALAQFGTESPDAGVVVETPFIVGIEANAWEAGLLVGYLGLNHTLFEAKNVVVDMESTEEFIFADMKIDGEFSFSPKLMLNRSFGSHVVLENSVSVAFGNFKQSVADNRVVWRKETDPPNTVSENEIETGSFFALVQDHSLTYYPRGEGRLQPYLSAGVGSQWYELDSDYVADGLSGAFSFSYGLGLRVVADDLYSFRFEVRNYHSQIEFKVAERWRQQQNQAGNALLSIPVMRLVEFDDATTAEILEIFDRLDLPVPDPLDATQLPQTPIPVRSFDPTDFTNLYFAMGFTAAF